MHRVLAAVMLTASLAVSACVTRADGAALGVTIAPLTVVAPGRIAIGVAVSGLQPALRPTIEGTVTVGSRMIKGPGGPVVAAYLPGVVDLAAGTFRLGGIVIFHFAPVPPPAQNTAIAVEVTVRQGGGTVTAHRSGMLLLPTVIVPGYLNDLDTKPDPDVISVLEQRGYCTTGPGQTVFWFTYPSRRLSLDDGAKALSAYVRRTVLPSTYAARINVVGYSESGLLARWNLVFDPDWAHLVNKFVMLGVPNEGTAATYIYGWYPAAAVFAASPGARDMFPTYPFWRPADGMPWTVPADGRNETLARLNARPLPDGVRVYALYGSGARTWAGLTGTLPDATFSYGPGDGIVLMASVLGLPINGGRGVPGLADRLISVDLGDLHHTSLLDTAISRIADVLLHLDR
jgi:hypothetical protein